VRKEVFEYRRAIDELQRRIRRSGENVRNWFNLFDADKDGHLEPEDFKRLLKQASVVVRDQDLARVFELIDLQQIGRISYSDFLNVVEKNVTLPIE
jgi:Ca2+-binding EF-hand superfamily protein